MNVTPWFPPWVLPVYTGWFERDYVVTKPRYERRWFNAKAKRWQLNPKSKGAITLPVRWRGMLK